MKINILILFSVCFYGCVIRFPLIVELSHRQFLSLPSPFPPSRTLCCSRTPCVYTSIGTEKKLTTNSPNQMIWRKLQQQQRLNMIFCYCLHSFRQKKFYLEKRRERMICLVLLIERIEKLFLSYSVWRISSSTIVFCSGFCWCYYWYIVVLLLENEFLPIEFKLDESIEEGKNWEK